MKRACMHINISTLHNVYILWWAQKYTDWWCLTSPMLHHGYLRRHSLIQGRISPNPGLTHVSSSGPGYQPFSHTPPALHTPPQKRMVEVCDAKRVLRYIPPTRLVGAFGRTTATSACAMVKKRQAHTHPLHWASPASLLPVCTAPPPCTCGNHFSNY